MVLVKFEYQYLEDKGGVRPVIPLILQGLVPIDALGLIDSGSDVSIISKNAAYAWGIRPSGAPSKGEGVGGDVKGWKTSVGLTLSQGGRMKTVTIPLNILDTDQDIPLLLGRAGFFDAFHICFDQPKRRITLESA